MRPPGCRLRIFALVWAVLQFALPTAAILADAGLVRGASEHGHVEEAGRDCAPSHSAECAVCKHLSASWTGESDADAPIGDDGRYRARTGCDAPLARTPAGVALPRAPPLRV